jgi:hypothetical protein
MFGAVESLWGSSISKVGFFIINATIHQDGLFLFAKLKPLISPLNAVAHTPGFQVDFFFSSPTLAQFEFYHIFFRELYIFHPMTSANFQFMKSYL